MYSFQVDRKIFQPIVDNKARAIIVSEVHKLNVDDVIKISDNLNNEVLRQITCITEYEEFKLIHFKRF